MDAGFVVLIGMGSGLLGLTGGLLLGVVIKRPYDKINEQVGASKPKVVEKTIFRQADVPESEAERIRARRIDSLEKEIEQLEIEADQKKDVLDDECRGLEEERDSYQEKIQELKTAHEEILDQLKELRENYKDELKEAQEGVEDLVREATEDLVGQYKFALEGVEGAIRDAADGYINQCKEALNNRNAWSANQMEDLDATIEDASPDC